MGKENRNIQYLNQKISKCVQEHSYDIISNIFCNGDIKVQSKLVVLQKIIKACEVNTIDDKEIYGEMFVQNAKMAEIQQYFHGKLSEFLPFLSSIYKRQVLEVEKNIDKVTNYDSCLEIYNILCEIHYIITPCALHGESCTAKESIINLSGVDHFICTEQ